MIYQKSVTTPVNTGKTSPKRSYMKVTKGFVYRVSIRIPPGPRGLVGVSVQKGSFALWPSSPGEWFLGDDERIEFDESYLIDAEPLHLILYTFNESVSYEHTIMLRIGLVSKRIFMARFLPSVAYEYYTEALQQLEEEHRRAQEEARRAVFEVPIFGGE